MYLKRTDLWPYFIQTIREKCFVERHEIAVVLKMLIPDD